MYASGGITIKKARLAPNFDSQFMTSAKLRGWGSYLSKKVDDTFNSIIPSEPQVSDQQGADTQEADPPYQQELLDIRERHEAFQSEETWAAYIYRQKQIREQKTTDCINILVNSILIYTGITAFCVAIVYIIILLTT